jgi:hypothetical protein
LAHPEPSVSEDVSASAINPDDAPPMQVLTGSWTTGSAAPSRPQLTLTLTNVAAVTVDASTAALPSATAKVVSDGPTRLTITHLRPGSRVHLGRRTIRVGSGGSVTLSIASGSSVLAWSR